MSATTSLNVRVAAYMYFAAVVVALLGTAVRPAEANAGVFTYYEDRFRPDEDSRATLEVGPARWRDLLIPNNQCGGAGQVNGYGQSPVVIPAANRDKCDTDLSGYEFRQGTCTWDQLLFRIVANGLIVGPRRVPGSPNTLNPDLVCELGRMRIPGDDHWYVATQFHLHANSEHSVAGSFYPAELHAVHVRDDGANFAVFGMFVDQEEEDGTQQNDVDDDDEQSQQQHEWFEHFLQGWEAVEQQTHEFCAVNENGSGLFSTNRLFRSLQYRVQCPAVGSGVDASNLEFVDEEQLLPIGWNETQTLSVPVFQRPDWPTEGLVPSIYQVLPTSSIDDMPDGIYTYRGGLTTPPCTELVRWNLLSKPMLISGGQLDRLLELILCFVERSTCRHSTVANHFGGTNRPPQPLNGRQIIHRCPSQALKNGTQATASTASEEKEILDDPPGPPVPAYKRNCLRISFGNQSNCVAIQFQPWLALLWPFFILAMSIVVHFVLSRFIPAFPFTAMMFVVGTIMGVCTSYKHNSNDMLTQSSLMWENINPELLFLAFLPGLIFGDAYNLDIHLLKDSFWQCVIMAFPMVLVGTFLFGGIGMYVLPYGWDLNLSLTFGAILSATDPVAVSALLSEVGAPPRLKALISGESLLNDGSAMVFYRIFSQLWFSSLNIPGLGMNIGVGQGFAIFFRMSLGAAVIGTAFGVALIMILHFLDQRFSHEESTVQVIAILAIAYLCYFVADAVALTSGVIASVACGVVVKLFGAQRLNNKETMTTFWELLEHILNTLIFALGGMIWGTVVSNSDPTRIVQFELQDWGYMFLIYILMMVVRAVLMVGFYPILSKIGLKWNIPEMIFTVAGGLRGAVGIALAISLDNELRRDTVPGDPRREYTTQIYGIAGGVAFLTLLINGSFAAPLLRKLGLADSPEKRELIVQGFERLLLENQIQTLKDVVSNDAVLRKVHLDIIIEHVDLLKKVCVMDLHEFIWPTGGVESAALVLPRRTGASSAIFRPVDEDTKKLLESMFDNENEDESEANGSEDGSAGDERGGVDEEMLKEQRKLYLEILRVAYEKQCASGELDVRKDTAAFMLLQSVVYSEDLVSQGHQLEDWKVLNRLSVPLSTRVRKAAKRHNKSKDLKKDLKNKISTAKEDFFEGSLESADERMRVCQAIAFVRAHAAADRVYREARSTSGEGVLESDRVLHESEATALQAKKFLKSVDDIEWIASLLTSKILLDSTAKYILYLTEQGFLKKQEAEEYMHLHIIDQMKKVDKTIENLGGDATSSSFINTMVRSLSRGSFGTNKSNDGEDSV